MKAQIARGLKLAMRAPGNRLYRSLGRSLKPRWLMFIVTERCNSRCAHCDIWQKEPVKDILTPQEIEAALSDPMLKDLEYIFNSGGEATLRNDLEEILLIEHRLFPRARLQLSTNGLLPDRVIDIAKFAVQHDIGIDIGVSLDGIGENHDRIRGVKGNFQKVDRLLRELVTLRETQGCNLGVTAGMTLSDLTLGSLEDVKSYTREMKTGLTVQWYNQSSFYGNVDQKLSADNRAFIDAVQSLPGTIVSQLWLRFLKGQAINFPCYALHTFCVLHPNGDVVPCLTHWDILAGNIRQKSFTEIWHSAEAAEARKIVSGCPGCLNEWGVGWSASSSLYPYLRFYLRHPRALLRYLRGQ